MADQEKKWDLKQYQQDLTEVPSRRNAEVVARALCDAIKIILDRPTTQEVKVVQLASIAIGMFESGMDVATGGTDRG